MPEHEDLLTMDEVAAMVRKTPGAFRQLRFEGRGPRAVKIGRSVRFRPSDVEEWIESQVEPAA